MALISLIDAAKDFGLKNLFEGIDLHINNKERLGLIGPNGAGKSTLLKILAGVEPLLHGKRESAPSLRIKLVEQDSFLGKTQSILESVLEGCGDKKDLLIEFRSVSEDISNNEKNPQLLKKLGLISEKMDIANAWNLEQQCEEVLRRLGIKELNKPVKELSGGYRKRVALASALVGSPDVLLLDEPTNHLDASAVEWLQSWLAKFNGALVLVTHDRYVLDRVTTRMIEVNNGQIRKYGGNYADFLKQKLAQEESEIASNRKFKGLLRKELAWLKQGPKARSTKQKARIQRITKMQSNSIINREDKPEFIDLTSRIGKIAIEAEDLQLRKTRNNQSEILFDSFSYNFSPEDRVGIIGRNGCGKSTLLDIIAGRKKPFRGKVRIGETVKIGYLDQHNQDLINQHGLERKVIEFIEEEAYRIKIKGIEYNSSKLLERFLFTPKQQHSPISKLSGGEKRRLSICRMLIKGPNVLLLDEPTNDLDIETLNILEEFINSFKGCVVIVSHDRYFLDRTVNRIFNIEEEKVTRFEGNYTDFLEKKKIKETNIKTKLNSIKNSPKKTKLSINQNKLRKRSFKENIELKNLTENLIVLEDEKKSLEQCISNNKGNTTNLSKDLAHIIELINSSEERWLELSDIEP